MAVTGVIERTVDINHGVVQEDLHRLFAVADAQAHTFKITVNANGVAQSLSGHTVIGYFMRNAGGTVVINGSVSGNVATLVLPQSCYSIIGGFQLIIRLVSGSTKTAIYWATGYITRSTTDPVVDPGSVVPDLNDLLAKIDEMEQATEAANQAATNANTAAEQAVRFDTAQTKTDAQKLQARNNAGAAGTGSLAPAYAQTTYAVGDMVTQGGKLYKCTTTITTAEEWTAGHWTEVAVSDEISTLKEDLNNMQDEIDNFEGISDEVKAALLACFAKVAWKDTSGQSNYDALAIALKIQKQFPDINNGELVSKSYYNANGEEAASSADIINRTYFEIDPNTTYKWIQGFFGNWIINNNLQTKNCLYRVLYYDVNRNYLGRDISPYSSGGEFGFIEPRYFEFTTPENARYIRISCAQFAPGFIVKQIPNNMYAVTVVLSHLDNSNITNDELYSFTTGGSFTVLRDGKNITRMVMFGNAYDEPPSDIYNVYWRKSIFSVLKGGSPEYSTQTEVENGIYNNKSFLLFEGDIIRFHNVKAAIRAERIVDGAVQHTIDSWITTDTDVIIGIGE